MGNTNWYKIISSDQANSNFEAFMTSNNYLYCVGETGGTSIVCDNLNQTIAAAPAMYILKLSPGVASSVNDAC